MSSHRGRRLRFGSTNHLDLVALLFFTSQAVALRERLYTNSGHRDDHSPHITKPFCVKSGCLDALNGAGGFRPGCRFGDGPGWLC